MAGDDVKGIKDTPKGIRSVNLTHSRRHKREKQ